MLVEWIFYRFPGIKIFNKHTSSVRKRETIKFQNFEPDAVRCNTWRRQNVLTENSCFVFPENFLVNLYLHSWKNLQKSIMTRYKHLTLTNTNMYANFILLRFIFDFVLINEFGIPLHLAFAKYLYMWLRRS